MPAMWELCGVPCSIIKSGFVEEIYNGGLRSPRFEYQLVWSPGTKNEKRCSVQQSGKCGAVTGWCWVCLGTDHHRELDNPFWAA